MQHITAKDDAWISNHYFRITTAWCRECFALEANKTRLVRVNIPIHIFHGTTDAHVPIEGVYDLASRFKVCGKDNLTLTIFENHKSRSDFQSWLTQKKYSAGLKELSNVPVNTEPDYNIPGSNPLVGNFHFFPDGHEFLKNIFYPYHKNAYTSPDGRFTKTQKSVFPRGEIGILVGNNQNHG